MLLLCFQKKDTPGHQFVELLLVLLVLGGDCVLGLLLHPLHKVLHVLEGIDLEEHRRKGRSHWEKHARPWGFGL